MALTSSYSFHCHEQQHISPLSSSTHLQVRCTATNGHAGKLSMVNTNGNTAAGLLSLERPASSHPLEILSLPKQGRFVEGVVYRQTFVVRSYEVGAEKTSNLETFLNYFQETALNHASLTGLAGDGFGATHQMIRNNLIWVVSRMQVEVEKYPTWGDVLEIDTWITASGKNGMRRDWLVRDYQNGMILARASSTWAMMHKLTRRLARMPEEVATEITPCFIDRSVFGNDILMKKIDKLQDSEYIRCGLSPRHSDLDMNQHVNNVKYFGWTMESLPLGIFDSHELVGITLQYRKECGKSDVVQSLTHPLVEQQQTRHHLEFTHLLRTEDYGSELVRSRTTWRRR